jgi:hypothetical protein
LIAKLATEEPSWVLQESGVVEGAKLIADTRCVGKRLLGLERTATGGRGGK